MQIFPGLNCIGDETGGHVRGFLIDHAGELILIDTLNHDDGRLVLEELRLMGKKPADIRRIILTHAHPSHLKGIAALKAATGARVYSHDWEADVVAGKRKMEVPATTGVLPQKPYRVYPFQLGLVFGLGKHAPCEVNGNLKDGDHVGPLTVVHTPGHTPGSLAFYWAEKRTVICGDIVSTWPELALGWPQITLDNKQNRESVGKLCDLTDAEILCVGHGAPILSGANDIIRGLVGKRAQPLSKVAGAHL